jgi:hypothetical protein
VTLSRFLGRLVGTLLRSMAFAAASVTTFWANVCVSWGVLVAVDAMGLCRPRTTLNVNSHRDWLKVIGIHAQRVSAEVIKRESCWYWSLEPLVILTVRKTAGLDVPQPHHAVADAVCVSLPDPAPSRFIDDVFRLRMRSSWLKCRIVTSKEAFGLACDPSICADSLWCRLCRLATSAVTYSEAIRPIAHCHIVSVGSI